MTRQPRRIKYAVGLSFIVAAMMVAFAVANVSAQVYPSGMVGYWKFDGSLIDELGIYNGTMGYYGSYADGIINQGLHGAKGCSNPFAAKVDNFPNLDSFTVEAWIKPSSPPDSWQGSLTVTKFIQTGYYNGIGFMLVTNPSPYESSNYTFYLIIRDGTKYQIVSSPLTYPSDNWYHVVAIRDYGKELKLFVNGEEVASALDNTVGSIANTEPLFFHGFSSGGCGWGMSAITMDEVAIYDRVLSEAEIQQHSQNGLQGQGFLTATPTTPPTVVITTVPPTPTATPVPTITLTTPPPTITYAPTPTAIAKFRVGPTVRLRPVTDVIERNQDGIVELYMDNPSLNDVTLKVETRVAVPSGIHVYGQSFGQAGAAGMVMGTFEVPPGTARTINVAIKADKSARIGSHSLQFTGLYWPGDNKDNYQPISLTYSVNVKEVSEEPEKPPKGTETPAPAKIPGFMGVLAMVSITGAAYLLSRR